MALGTVDSWMALGSAIYARLAPPLGSAFYDTLAPQGGTPPYTLWQVLTTDDEYSFDRHGETLYVQIRSISNQVWPAHARRVYGTAHAYMQDAPLSVSGFQVLRCRRVDKFQYPDPDGFWNVGGVYQVELVKT